MAQAPTPRRRKLRQETISRRAAQATTERERVLVAAATLFGALGYHETTMREVATRAGFSIGALYKRFASKDHLYCDVVETHFRAIWNAIDGIIEQDLDFGPEMFALTEAIFTHYTVNRSFLRVYGIQPPAVAEPFHSHIREMQSQERSHRALVDALRRGQQDGLIEGDVEFLAAMYVGMIGRAVNDYLANKRPLPTVSEILTLFLRGAARPENSARGLLPTVPRKAEADATSIAGRRPRSRRP